jgi:hypothetical protein
MGRHPIFDAALGENGGFWPRRAVDFICGLRSHAARAQAFREIPEAFQVMAARMLHRTYYNRAARGG